jgi:hypothetical protein
MCASLCELDAVRCATQTSCQKIGLAVDVVGGSNDCFGKSSARFDQNVFAQCDYLIVLEECGVQSIDRGDVVLHPSAQRLGERFLFGRDDGFLQLGDLSVTVVEPQLNGFH